MLSYAFEKLIMQPLNLKLTIEIIIQNVLQKIGGTFVISVFLRLEYINAKWI